MSYDLQFCVPAGARAPAITEIEAYFRGRPWYDVQGSQAFYGNEDTGVYFSFDVSAPDADAAAAEEDVPQDGLQAVPLSFNVNYVRPSVFGLEAERELTAVTARFGLLVDDPQAHGMGRGPYSAAGFLSGWNHGNEIAYRAVVDHLRSEGADAAVEFGTVLPAAEIERCWRWNVLRNDLQSQLGEGVFVPRISFMSWEGGVRSFVVWGDAMSIALPDVDLLMLVRQQLAPRRFLVFKAQDVALARFSDLGPLLALAGRALQPVPHLLFAYDVPPTAVQEFFRSRVPFRGGHVGVPVDKVLDAELMQKALALH